MTGSKSFQSPYTNNPVYKTIEANNVLAQILRNLDSILEQALNAQIDFTFNGMKKQGEYPEFQRPHWLQMEIVKPSENILKVEKPDFIDKLLGGDEQYKRAVWEARNKYNIALDEYNRRVDERNKQILRLRDQYEKDKEEFEISKQRHNRIVDELEAGYKSGSPDAVKRYCAIILNSSPYPQDFPHKFRLAYLSESKELVIEYELPNKQVVPEVGLNFSKATSTYVQKKRKASEVKESYQSIVAAICLRTIFEVIKGDQGNYLDVVVFNGFVTDVDPATGKDIHPCLVSIRTTKERFSELNLSRVDKIACLRNLGAQVSPQPSELQPVKPVVEFDMVDKRFVKEQDVLSDLESRPNLMDLNPWEFENLVNNLFSKMGLEAKLTRSSKDGGVDVVAFDLRPILGGKVVIQAKRYKNVVGVSAVRDLYGTMINEGASKGILVTTSHYGPDAYDFAKDKPIELIDGGGLLYLLEQNGTKARIIFPEDAKD